MEKRIPMILKLFEGRWSRTGGQVVSDWWRKSGHRVDVEDIADILESRPDIVVIGKGSPGLMKTSTHLRESLAANNIVLIEKKTSKAIEVFNKLSQEGKAGR
jgi:hypothetical protein